MIYPKNFEKKIGFDEIKDKLSAACLSTLGKGLVEQMSFSDDPEQINTWMEELHEMRRIEEEEDDFPLTSFFDVRDSLKRVRLQNTWMEESELFDLRRSLKTIDDLVKFLYRGEELPDQEDDDSDVVLKKWDYPALHDPLTVSLRSRLSSSKSTRSSISSVTSVTTRLRSF